MEKDHGDDLKGVVLNTYHSPFTTNHYGKLLDGKAGAYGVFVG